MVKNNKMDARLDQARKLVAHLEAGETEKADQVLISLSGTSDSSLFIEVGRLTRELHEAINGFLLDSGVAHLAQQEIPDAKERLSYVIAKTEQAAHTTLTAVEKSIPMVVSLENATGDLHRSLDELLGKRSKLSEFRAINEKIRKFLEGTHSDAGVIHQLLSEVLIAQDYQDITGQIIRRVIELVKDVEDKLVQLIRLSGPKTLANEKTETRKLEGPRVPGIDQGDTVNGQDDVDELLLSMGF